MPDYKSPDYVDSSQNSSKVCDLCGLRLRAGRFEARFSGKTYQFCCQGCRQVFSILIEATDSGDPAKFRESDLFKQCQEKGILPRSEADLVSTNMNGKSNESPPGKAEKLVPAGQLATSTDGVLGLNLKVSNMWCPACAWLIDESLKKTPGVIDSACNFSTDRLQVTYNPVRTSPTRIINSIKHLGYNAAVPEESQDEHEKRKEFIRFAISAFLTMNVMMLSYALYSGFFTQFDAETIYKLSWPAFIMTTIVLVYGGFEFFKKAWAGLTNAAFSMETLIIIGSLSAYSYSTVNLFAGGIHLYYDTACMLITLVLLGKTLERRAKGQVLEGLENFFSLRPTKVRICNDEFPEGRFVSAEQLAEDDIFLVDESEIIPADGEIIAGTGSMDESSLTGEPQPVTKKPGQTARSGTRVLKGTLKIKAEKVGDDSTLGQMIDIIEKTLLAKTPLEGRTDIILRWFVPVIIALAAGTAFVCLLIGISTGEAILRAVTVLVISCPCALGIAIPLARVAGISIAGKKGILVKDFEAFEQAERVTAFVFDKTGTLTEGRWTLLDIIVVHPFTEDAVIAFAAGLEKQSDHLIGREILRQSKKRNIRPVQLEKIRTKEQGLIGESEGKEIKIGSADFLVKEFQNSHGSISDKERDDISKHSFVYLSIEGYPAAVFVFGDTLRESAVSTIKKLQRRGYLLALVSGDGDATTKAVGRDVGVLDSYGGKLPHHKADFVQELQTRGNQVAMVGDGINDAPALVQADLSIAVHSGGQLSKEAADITLMRGEPSQILEFLNFAKQVNKRIYQNLAFTFLYNAVSIPIAMSGLLNPLIAVSAMLLSSLSVTGNTLFLVRKNN